MRTSFVIAFAAAAVTLAGCDSNVEEGGGGNPTVPMSCGQTASCPVSQECLAIVDNAGNPRFGLRISELGVQTPAVFAQGFLANILRFWVEPNVVGCVGASSLGAGSGATSWLLRFDLEQQTLTMGGAAPPADPAQQGYTFVDAMVPQGPTVYHAAPTTFALVTNADGSLATAAPQDLDLAMFFEVGTTVSGPVALPLHALSASNVVVSPSHDCIGRYDPADIDPPLCSPSDGEDLYFHGGHLESYVSLEEADAISFGALNETLCVVLTGNPDEYGDSPSPISHCTRTAGVIDFKGDWCSQTNAPATASCADAVHFTADFAASAVTIQP